MLGAGLILLAVSVCGGQIMVTFYVFIDIIQKGRNYNPARPALRGVQGPLEASYKSMKNE